MHYHLNLFCDKIKHIYFISFFLFPLNNLKSQYSTPVISELNIWVLSLSVNYNYYNGDYLPYNIPVGSNFQLHAQALAALHERYYFNKQMLLKEYYKLRDLQLINKKNIELLANYKAERMNWLFDAINHWDLSVNANASTILNYCCAFYKFPEIRAEMELIRKCHNEIFNLKYSKPYDYYNTKRYRAIAKVLDKLTNCIFYEISDLNWEYYELEEDKAIKKEQSKRYVISKTVNIRTFASADASIITNLKLGTELELIEVVNDHWSKVNFWYFDYNTYSNIYSTGYVYSSFISR